MEELTQTPKAKRHLWRVVLPALCVAAVAIGGITNAWMSRNKTVERSGMTMTIQTSGLSAFFKPTDDEYAYANAATPVNEKKLDFPGSEVEYELGIINDHTSIITFHRFDIEAPVLGTDDSANERPTNKGLYMGRYLLASIPSYTVYTNTTLVGGKLVPGEGGTETTYTLSPTPVRLLTEDSQSPGVLTMLDLGDTGILMEPNTVIVFKFVIHFEETGEDQSDLMGYGTPATGGYFSRIVNLDLS